MLGHDGQKNNMRVVLDTNVILSALLFANGNLAWLKKAWQAKSIRPVISNATKEDLFESLNYPKFNLSIAEQDLLLEDFFHTVKQLPYPTGCHRMVYLAKYFWQWHTKPR